MDLKNSLSVSASGLRAHALRMRIIAENLANQDSVATMPGADPYRRRMVSFRAAVDRATGATTVKADRVVADRSDFGKEYRPGHPAADKAGYIATPNVNSLVESTDMSSAQRSYEANLSAIESAKSLTMRTIDLLR